MRRLFATGALVASLAGAACAGQSTPGTPTAPSPDVAPFIVSSPAPYTGTEAPGIWGVWTGAMHLTDCRAAPPSVCKVAPTPREIRLVIPSPGVTLTGVFTMNEPGGPAWAFAGYVTATGGIAGTATIDGDSRVLVRLTADGPRLSGEVADEVRTNGRLTFTRHFVVSTPLRRVGPTL